MCSDVSESYLILEGQKLYLYSGSNCLDREKLLVEVLSTILVSFFFNRKFQSH